MLKKGPSFTRSLVKKKWANFRPEEEARRAVEALGVPVAWQPDEEAPRLPRDITAISSEDLGYLHGSFSAYTAYLADQTALAETAASRVEAYYELFRAEVRLRKSGTVADKDAKTLADPEVQTLEQELLVAQAKARLLKAKERGYDRQASALSREMTRRGIQNG